VRVYFLSVRIDERVDPVYVIATGYELKEAIDAARVAVKPDHAHTVALIEELGGITPRAFIVLLKERR
jgi:hypothetical protein